LHIPEIKRLRNFASQEQENYMLFFQLTVINDDRRW